MNIPKEIEDYIIKVQIASREAICNIVTYVELLEKWNPVINLVAKSTMPDVWRRHILDSAQLYSHIEVPHNKTLIDLGSGAGFPGMVLAMLGVGAMGQVHLIESDGKKCEFLREVARKTGTKVEIHPSRIENCDIKGDIITARALAPLGELIEYSKDKLNPNGKCFFLKGKEWQAELKQAQKAFDFDCTDYESITDPQARILKIENLRSIS